MGRSQNVSHYKWRVLGTLDGHAVDKRYLSIQHFLDEYGGQKTALNLNRHKIKRLREGQADARWQLKITPIKESRLVKRVYFD
jgi:hypothetical protein